MSANKYLDFAFETAVDAIDVGAFKPEDTLKIIITGMKSYRDRNGFKFSDEEIRERAVAGLKELAVAEADFDTAKRVDSVNAPKETTKEDFLGYAFDFVTAGLALGGFKMEDSIKVVATGMKEYARENGQEFTDEEIADTVSKAFKDFALARATAATVPGGDIINEFGGISHEEFLQNAFDSVTAVLDLGGFKPEDALKMAVTGMKAYAYDNNQNFGSEEVLEYAKKKMKEIFGASKDFEYQDWAMKR